MKKIVCFTVMLAFLLPVSAFAGGAETYKAKCSACHGANGEGKAAMKTRDLGSPDVQKLTDAQLIQITADGKGKMPAYSSKLSADEIKAVVAHIRTMKK